MRHDTRLLLVGVALGLVATLGAPPCRAADSQAEDVVGHMSRKFLRGLVNVVTSPAELPKQVYRSTRDEGAVVGVPLGFLKGIGMIVCRAGFGAAETATFLVPAPGYYDPLMQPVFVWRGWSEPSVSPAD